MSERLAEATGPKMAVAAPCTNRSRTSTNNADASEVGERQAGKDERTCNEQPAPPEHVGQGAGR